MSVATGFVAIAVLLGLLVLRVPIAYAMILVSFGGVVSMVGLGPAMGLLASGPHDFVASWTLSAVPMFLLMGFVCYHSGMTSGLFAAANVFLRRVPGGWRSRPCWPVQGLRRSAGLRWPARRRWAASRSRKW